MLKSFVWCMFLLSLLGFSGFSIYLHDWNEIGGTVDRKKMRSGSGPALASHDALPLVSPFLHKNRYSIYFPDVLLFH